MHKKEAIYLTNFYKNYCDLCAKHEVSPSFVASRIGLSNAAASGWKKGKYPSDVTLAKLSQYFGVPVSDLTGEQKEKPSAENGEELEYSDMELLAAYRSADEVTRELIRRALGL